MNNENCVRIRAIQPEILDKEKKSTLCSISAEWMVEIFKRNERNCIFSKFA